MNEGETPKPEQEVGKITGYFAKPCAASLTITKGSLKVGDNIWIKGHTTDLKQTIASMQVDNQPVQEAHEGQSVGIKVSDRVRHNDIVYKI